MLNRIFALLRRDRANNRCRARRTYSFSRPMRIEQLEDRSMLATLTLSVNTDGAIANNDGNLTIREAIAYVNGTATPDAGDLAHISGRRKGAEKRGHSTFLDRRWRCLLGWWDAAHCSGRCRGDVLPRLESW
jgi:hypothetical protein